MRRPQSPSCHRGFGAKNGGTTTLEVARALGGKPQLRARVITTSPPIAAALASHPGLEVTVVGGTLRPNSLVTVGATAVQELRLIRADVVLLGVSGLIATGPLLARDEDDDAHAPTMRWRSLPSRLVLLGIACLFCLIGMGTGRLMADRLRNP
jgi:DeoR C terminal sensor domain